MNKAVSPWLFLRASSGSAGRECDSNIVLSISSAPSRFSHTLQRIRYYGWQSPNSKLKFQWVQMLVWFHLGWCWLMKQKQVVEAPRKPPLICKQCKVGTLELLAITDGEGRMLYRRRFVGRNSFLPEHAIAYLDSG